ncbi:class I tRNA ligase family protein [Nocardia suismassiliense]|uniref:class I tRNA ligase family protein n=1 Tax=Nocardia suismassiliense TaxID=2077092 RepID=UPI0018FF05E2|nr:class I tRNA ligase family protein [Nocardia suismassiliense]
MIINRFDTAELHSAFGIDMSSIDGFGFGAGWARVPPGGRSDPHQHDETELFLVVSGHGDVIVDGGRHPVAPGMAVLFDPFETHVVENTGSTELVFFDLYWRDPSRAARASTGRSDRRRFGERPIFVFSTPPTPNGDLHLGHLSGPYLGADVFVRFQRMNGAQAWHLTGSDDYQSYVVERARREGKDPAATAAYYSAEIAETLRLMDIEPDQYTVTDTEPTYRAGLQAYFSRLVKSGSVAPQEGKALFDAATHDYLYEADVTGGCPGCGAVTGGNICEGCGEPNSCVDLADPQSKLSQEPPRIDTITRFTLPLHEFATELAAHHRLGRVPARLRELAGRLFARPRLDVAMTHPANWGVPPAEPDVDGQVIWVWPEMSYGFLHSISALGRRLGRDWRADEPEQDWKIVHFFGYDNSFYHSILYPVLYRLAFPDWQPDIDYHVNEFYLLDGGKFSTSRRHAVWGKEILSPDSVDGVRYFLSRTRPESRRTNFTHESYTAAVRDELIGTWQQWLNDLGRRIQTRYGGHAPDAGIWTPEHTAFLGRLGARLSAVTAALGPDGFSLEVAAAELHGIVTDTRRFVDQESAVATAEDWYDEARTAVALELAAARLLAHCATPVLPRFAGRLGAALGEERPNEWPHTVELVPAGTRVDLVGEFFAEPAVEAAEPVGVGSA